MTTRSESDLRILRNCERYVRSRIDSERCTTPWPIAAIPPRQMGEQEWLRLECRALHALLRLEGQRANERQVAPNTFPTSGHCEVCGVVTMGTHCAMRAVRNRVTSAERLAASNEKDYPK